MKNYIIWILMGLFVIAPAVAEDEQVIKARTQVELTKKITKLNTNCHSQITFTLDWESFSKVDWQGYSLQSFCGTPIVGLGKLCIGKQTQTYVQKNIKSITCRFGGEGNRALKIENGVMMYSVDFKAPNSNQFSRAALMKNL